VVHEPAGVDEGVLVAAAALDPMIVVGDPLAAARTHQRSVTADVVVRVRMDLGPGPDTGRGPGLGVHAICAPAWFRSPRTSNRSTIPP